VIRVLPLDDQTLVREGIRVLLDLLPAIESPSSRGRHIALASRRGQPIVALLTCACPSSTVSGVLRSLREENRLPPTIVLTHLRRRRPDARVDPPGREGVLFKKQNVS